MIALAPVPAIKNQFVEPDKSLLRSLVKALNVREKMFYPAPSVAPQGLTIINLSIPNLTPDKAAEITSGKATLIQYGEIRYEDIFGQKHYGKFCLVVTLKGDGYEQGFCPVGNDLN